jgi:hypothetical protein
MSNEPIQPTPEIAPAAASNWRESLARVLRQPQFVLVAIVMLVAAVGLNASVQFLKLHFKKEAIPLARDLRAIPERFGSWVQVSEDKPLSSEIEDVLGTDKYIFREYVDERIAGADVQQRFKNLRELIDAATSPDERRRLEDDYAKLLPQIRSRMPNAVISLSVTYYTGMVDTVAHVPDRCVTADGYEPKSYETVKWPIGRDLAANKKPLDGDGKPSDEIEVRYINFEDQTGTSNVPRSITYFFSANGAFESSPLGVRRKLADLSQRKAYYAKIEVMTTMENARDSARVQTDFLTAAMPEIQRCLPDWDKAQPKSTEVAQVK